MKVNFAKKDFTHPLKDAVTSFLVAAKTAEAETKTFEEIRAALGKDAGALPDGVIHQIAKDAGFEVSQG